ncbi:2710_t:CDS:2, partial [Funneliformis geosporum]
KTQDKQIIIDSNSNKSKSDSNVLKTLEINAYDTVNTLYNKNEIEENDRKERELINGEESETLQIPISTSYPISNLSEISVDEGKYEKNNSSGNSSSVM